MAKVRVPILALVIMCLAACTRSTTPVATGPSPTLDVATATATSPTPGGTLVICSGAGTPRHFNPALLSGSATAMVGAQVFASPLRYDENWNPLPYLAKSWELAEDGLSLTLHLVQGATFHDGVPVTSRDVAFSVMTVKENHPFKTMFAPVTQVETPDDHTAVIRLSHAHPAILLAMSPALLPILPEHIYGDGQDLATHPANLIPVGSGPFRFVSYVPDESITLEHFEGFFVPGHPYLDKLIFRLEQSPAAQMIEMQRQTAQLMPVFSEPIYLTRLGQMPHLVVTSRGNEAYGAEVWLAFNLLREPLNDVKVRQALAYAIDADFIVDYMHQGWSERAVGPIVPQSPFFDEHVERYSVDLELAEELLDQAGYPRDDDGWRFAVSLDYIPTIPAHMSDVALYLKSQLAKIGVRVELLDSVTFPAWAQRIGDWDFDMTLDIVYNWGDPVIGVHRTYQSSNIRQGVVWSNTQNYRNPKVDAILDQAAVELDLGKRKALYDEFQQIVTKELPVIWLNTLPVQTIYHVGLGNPLLTIWGISSPLDDVYWQQTPQPVYQPPLVLEAGEDHDPVVVAGVRAIELLQQENFYTARDRMYDPQEGLLDLTDSGLHVIGFTREGVVFVDNSGDLQEGMDMSNLLSIEGRLVLPVLLETAQDNSPEPQHFEGIWPHPSTGQLGQVSVWCGELTAGGDIVCALAWEPQGEPIQ